MLYVFIVTLLSVFVAGVRSENGNHEPPKLSEGAMRVVSLHVLVTSEGSGVANIPMTANYIRSFGQGFTDARGAITLSLSVPPRARMVAVFPSPILAKGLVGDALRTETENQRAQIARHAFSNWYRVALSDSASDYDLNIEVGSARSASLRALAGSLPVADAVVYTRDAVVDSRSDGAGAISVGGLSKDSTSILYIWAAGKAVARVAVPAGGKDAVLGDIELSMVKGAAQVKITPTRSKGGLWRPEASHSGVTLVSIDGSKVFSLFVYSPGGYTTNDASGTSLPWVPPGEYFVTGGTFAATLSQVLLIERSLSGADLKAVGLPTIVAASGKISELEFDPRLVDEMLAGGGDKTDLPNLASPTAR